MLSADTGNGKLMLILLNLDSKSFVITHSFNAMDGSDFGTPAVTVEASELESSLLLPVAVGPNNVHPILLVDTKHQVS